MAGERVGLTRAEHAATGQQAEQVERREAGRQRARREPGGRVESGVGRHHAAGAIEHAGRDGQPGERLSQVRPGLAARAHSAAAPGAPRSARPAGKPALRAARAAPRSPCSATSEAASTRAATH